MGNSDCAQGNIRFCGSDHEPIAFVAGRQRKYKISTLHDQAIDCEIPRTYPQVSLIGGILS
jgi:hypothetical protein